MARDFNGSSDLITLSTEAEFTNTSKIALFCWAYIDTTTIIGNLFVKRVGANITFQLRIATDGKLIWLWTQGASAFQSFDSGNPAVSTGSWHAIGINYDWATPDIPGVDYWVDGVKSSCIRTGGTGTTPDDVNVPINLGNYAGGTQWLDGRMAEAARWNRELTDAEMTILSKGFSPAFIKNGLQDYLPLIGKASPEVELKSGNNGVLTGTSVASHPRIIYPRNFQVPSLAATGGTTPYVDVEPGQYTNRSPQELLNSIAGNTPLTGSSMQEVIATALGVQPRTGKSVQELLAQAYGITPGTAQPVEQMLYNRLVTLGVTFPSPWVSYSTQQLLDKAVAQGFTLSQLLALS